MTHLARPQPTRRVSAGGATSASPVLTAFTALTVLAVVVSATAGPGMSDRDAGASAPSAGKSAPSEGKSAPSEGKSAGPSNGASTGPSGTVPAGNMPGGNPAGTRKNGRLTDEEMLGMLGTLWPELQTRLIEQSSARPKIFRERMDRMRPVLERLEHLRRDQNSAMADLLWESFVAGEECRELAQRWHQATEESARAELAAQVRVKLAQQLDLELKLKEAELADFERKLDKLRGDLRRQQAGKEKVVNERLVRWLGKAASPKSPGKTDAVKPEPGKPAGKGAAGE